MNAFFVSFLGQGKALAVVGGGSALLLAFSFAWAVRALARLDPLPFPCGGVQREARLLAVRESWMRFADLPLRYSAALLHRLLSKLQKRSRAVDRRILALLSSQQRLLIWAGQPAGLYPLEVWVLCLTCSFGFAWLAWAFGSADGTLLWLAPGALLGLALPIFRLYALASERFVEMRRELPAAIDLTALGMSAGCDFPSALGHVLSGQRGVVADEFRQVLMALELGTTRKTALLALESRVPVDEVSDLVRAIVLAEEKGSTVAEALGHQAQLSRQRRSVRAEEAAARAGTLLLVPLMLLMGCIVLMLFGPLIIESGVWGG